MAQINTQDRVGKRSGAVQFEHYQVDAMKENLASILSFCAALDIVINNSMLFIINILAER